MKRTSPWMGPFYSCMAWVVACALVLVSAGCAKGPEVMPSGSLPSPQGLIEYLKAYNSQLHSLRAWATIRWVQGADHNSADHGLLLRVPDRLRLMGMGPFGGAIYNLAIHGDQVTVLLNRKRVAYMGKASKADFEKLFSMPLEPRDAIPLLCGRVPLAMETPSIFTVRQGLAVEWTSMRGKWRGRLILRPPHRDPVSLEFLRVDNGRLVFSVQWDRYKRISGVRIPLDIHWAMPSLGREVDISLSDPEVNVPLREAVFLLDLPSSVRVLPLGDLTGMSLQGERTGTHIK